MPVQLIEKLWLPSVRSFSKVARPRKKCDFNFKLFTFTDGISFDFESRINDDGFALKSDGVARTPINSSKKFRTESEGFDEVVDCDVYDNGFLGESCPLRPHLPFDIFHFNFIKIENSSDVHVAQEIDILDKSIAAQNAKTVLLIYTTDLSDIISVDLVRRYEGTGLFDSDISELEDKKSFIRYVMEKIAEKHSLRCVELKDSVETGVALRPELYSITSILRKAVYGKKV